MTPPNSFVWNMLKVNQPCSYSQTCFCENEVINNYDYNDTLKSYCQKRISCILLVYIINISLVREASYTL